MKNYQSAYKAYDIRSVWDEPIDATFVYNLGRGVGKHLLDTVGEEASFVFAADVREANNELIYRFLKGLEEGGCTHYVNIGVPVEAVDEEQAQVWGVASTMLLYYCAKHTFDMGVVFTASHNPPEYVGMKIVNREALLIESSVLSSWVDEYIPVEEEIDETDFERIFLNATGEENPLYPLIEEKITSLTTIYGERFSDLEKTYTFVVDFSNGSAVGYEKIFLEEIVALGGHTIISLNDVADSEFRSHLSDTTDPHDYQQLMDKVQEEGADFGILFDGDADRLGVVDNNGNMIGGDIVTGMIAINMLKRGGDKKKVVYDVFFTKAIPEEIERWGGQAIKSRVGHRFIKELFKKEQALFAGELSAHLFFEEVGGFECPLLALYYLMDECASHTSVAEAIAPLQKYYKPPLRKYEVADRAAVTVVLDRIKEHYAQYTLDYTDGVGVYGDDFWFVIRASNTEPVLKMVLEADTEEIWNTRIVELEAIIGS